MRAAFPLVLVFALAAGCASSGGVTKKAYQQKANAICSRYTKKVDSLRVGGPTEADIKRLVEATAAVVRTENARLRKLDPPTAERKDVRAMLDARDRLVETFARNAEAIAAASVAAARGGGAAAQARLQAILGPPTARARRLTSRVGLKTCVREFRSGA